MRFVDCVDYGDAPTILISGPASISLIDDNVQIIHFVRVKMVDGLIENRAACRLIVPWRLWLDAGESHAAARAHVMQELHQLGSRVGMH